MKCLKCGHDGVFHHSMNGCSVCDNNNECYCTRAQIEQDTADELNIRQARLTLARELIAALTNNGQLSPRLMTPETKTLWERWQAEEGKP